MAKFFTSDWHLNEDRITPKFNPFFRSFASVEEQNKTIIDNCNAMVGEDDELFHIGDVSIDIAGCALLDQIKCKRRTLIIGNYDDDKLFELGKYFNTIQRVSCINIGDRQYRLNHYPAKAVAGMMNIVGHIHGLWKVQPGIINVGVDAWNFKPLSEAEILFITEAMGKHYDENVFPLEQNLEAFRKNAASEGFKKWNGL